MDNHISQILTTSLRNQVSEMDANISFTYSEITEYLRYSTTIGFMTDRHKMFTCVNIISPFSKDNHHDLGPRVTESLSFTDDYNNYHAIHLEEHQSILPLKNYHFLDVLTFHRLLFKKLKTSNRDLVKMVTLKHFKTVCEYYKDQAQGLLLFLYLRMNIRVLNIPFKFPNMRLSRDEADEDSDISTESETDEYMHGRYLDFTCNNEELYQQITESINGF